MQRFIRYLYEYEQAKRIRNVGFVKVEAGNEETIVHMQAKGFHNSNDRKLVLYLFYEDEGKLVVLYKCELCLTTPVLSEHLRYSRKDDKLAGNYDRIKGVMIETETGRRMAASWDDSCVDVSKIEESGHSNSSVGRYAHTDSVPCPVENVCGHSEENCGRIAQGNMLIAQQEVEQQEVEQQEVEQQEVEQQEAEQQEAEQVETEAEAPEKQLAHKFTKISRQELAKLPRCEWRLANNQFLIYGYRNYRHLVLVKDDDSWKLGVPGIYHKKEEEVAKIFGFGEFLPMEETDISLQKEEMHQNEPFGYWCRPVRRR